MRKGAKAAVIGGVFVAMVGAAGYGAYSLTSDDGDSAGDSTVTSAKTDGAAKTKTPVKTGPPSEAEVRKTVGDFLAAWGRGDAAEAAALTSDEKAARAALDGYRKQARVNKVTLTPGTPTGAKAPFRVSAEIVHEQQRATWAYDSALTVVRDAETGEARVDWKPSVVFPKLRPGDTVRTGPAKKPPIKAVDRNGKELVPAEHPTLKVVLSGLRDKYGAKAGGTAGVELYVDRAGKTPDETLKVLSNGTPGTLRTTLDSGLQRVAEQQVAKKPKSSAVVIKPSTGEVLALANSPAEGFNTALQGSLAPGSTMKVVSSALLIDKGLAGTGKQHPCPKFASYGGWKFQNLDKFEIKGGTFDQSFARSCNTAFITQASKLSDDALTQEARDVFGIGLNWQTGVPTFDGAVPVQQDASKAASLIGQGGVRMNPLTMASVSATASTGTFRQPYLVAPSLDNRTLAKAPRAMKPDTVKQLKSLMKLTATAGTGAQAMSGLSGDIGAKTGSAEVDGQKKPNGWFTAYRGDVAAAAVVQQGGHGGEAAGPIVAALLRAG
ncbi:penicillin-binding transpeptidase domain-containing protein [Streptomyces sp. 71268]|uniref:penicillin-binding transpeptidase domain-containing protein n=1 Tax=Streptomyces sp. 71268 TaxID=3002640 RepID=UPI0023F6B5F6|nr:penicillin-binding transpeptidase domain-containing protein [Streptomyces sp. 71268]WEV25805.1 penicillin-binding transpeptidase domain-containing protein [Streptomyces sp. 71268]